MSNSITRQPFWTLALLAVILVPSAAVGCSGQKTEEPNQVADQAPPPPAEQEQAPERSAPPPQREKARAEHRTPEHRAAGTIPEDRPRRISPEPPQEPATVTLTIPKGTALEVRFTQPLTSETARVGDAVTTELKNPLIVGERVVFPAGSRVEGRVTDVKSAKKGFKDTGGALAVSFDRLISPDGRESRIAAAFTKLAEGSGKKKAAIIGGSAAGALILGKMLGKDGAGAAVLGGAVGTAVAGSTKGKEAMIGADQTISVALEQPAEVTVKR